MIYPDRTTGKGLTDLLTGKGLTDLLTIFFKCVDKRGKFQVCMPV